MLVPEIIKGKIWHNFKYLRWNSQTHKKQIFCTKCILEHYYSYSRVRINVIWIQFICKKFAHLPKLEVKYANIKNIIIGLKTNSNHNNSHSRDEIYVSQWILHCRTLHTSQILRWDSKSAFTNIQFLVLTSDLGWCALFCNAISMETHLFLLHCVNYEDQIWFHNQKLCF